ncbi:MAG: hypothetical protein AB2L24_07030 [Mangrovibacterium sp.]
MNKKMLFPISICFLMTSGCEKGDITVATGIVGNVEYGQGDCMPVIDYESREYSDYDGKLYFVLKEDLDNLEDGDYEQLKNSSLNVQVKQGKLSTKLPAGTYLVMPEDFYVYSEENTITIKPEEVLHKNFKFFKCTSY